MNSKIPPNKTFFMNILKTRKVQFCELDIDCPDHVIDELATYGMTLIKDDKQALFNYAFNAALKEYIKEKKISGAPRKGNAKKIKPKRKSS